LPIANYYLIEGAPMGCMRMESSAQLQQKASAAQKQNAGSERQGFPIRHWARTWRFDSDNIP
jgi:hypothetical protein